MPEETTAPPPLARYLLEVHPQDELRWFELDVAGNGAEPPAPATVKNIYRFERVLIQALAFLQRELLLGRIFGELDQRQARVQAAAQVQRLTRGVGKA